MQPRTLIGAAASLVIGAGILVSLPSPAGAATGFDSTVASAGRYGTTHIGRAGVAVYDRQTHRLSTGGRASAQVSAASTVKAFVAADLLYRNAHRTIRLSAYDFRQMTPMITQSSNSAFTYLWNKYGGDRIVRNIIHRYGLTQTATTSVPGFWGFTRMTAHDFALFLGKAADDRTVGPWLTTTMSHSQHIVGGFDQWFGIPASGIRPFAIKQGWTCCDTGDILNSTGYVGTNWRYTIAIFTSGSSAHHRAYIDTMARVLLPGGGIPEHNPYAALDYAHAYGERVHLTGYAVDPDHAWTRMTVALFEGNKRLAVSRTNVYSAWVNRTFHSRGNHRYRFAFSAKTGRHRYCVRGYNLGAGTHNTWNCRIVTVNGAPLGVLSTASAGPRLAVHLTGWAFDRSRTSASIDVRVYDGANLLGTFPTNAYRANVNHYYRIHGHHGFAITVSPHIPSSHVFHVYAVNIGYPGPDVQLSYSPRTVNVLVPLGPRTSAGR